MKSIGTVEMVNMLRAASSEIRANHERLSELDSHGGDGDHGTTMLRAMDILDKALADNAGVAPAPLFSAVGWALMGVDGGATGPLFGAFFSGLAGPAESKETLDAGTVAASFEAGLAAIQKYSKANRGDKTMLDALIPAVEAARAAADGGADVENVLAQAAGGARAGAEATKALQARFGRAKNIGAASIGNQDAGATSVALIFQGFENGVRMTCQR